VLLLFWREKVRNLFFKLIKWDLNFPLGPQSVLAAGSQNVKERNGRERSGQHNRHVHLQHVPVHANVHQLQSQLRS
jgi:hypothetical protein